MSSCSILRRFKRCFHVSHYINSPMFSPIFFSFYSNCVSVFDGCCSFVDFIGLGGRKYRRLYGIWWWDATSKCASFTQNSNAKKNPKKGYLYVHCDGTIAHFITLKSFNPNPQTLYFLPVWYVLCVLVNFFFSVHCRTTRYEVVKGVAGVKTKMMPLCRKMANKNKDFEILSFIFFSPSFLADFFYDIVQAPGKATKVILAYQIAFYLPPILAVIIEIWYPW